MEKLKPLMKVRLNATGKNVIIVVEYERYQRSFIKMLEFFETMWDGTKGQINVAKQRIE